MSLSCIVRDLLPWPGIQSGPPELGGHSFSYWTTRQVSPLLIRTPVILDESPVRGSPFPIASSLRAPSPNMVMFWSTASCGFRGEVGTQFSPWHCQMGDADMNPTLTTTWTTNSTVIPEPMRAKPRGFDWGVSRKPPLRKWYLGWDLKKRWRLNRERGSSRPGRGNGVCWEMVAPSRALEELKGS